MNLLIHDSCDVVIENKRTGNIILTTESQLNSISGTLGIDTTIFGGIGVRPISKVRGQKELSTTYRNAMYNKETLAMQHGVEVKEEVIILSKIKEGLKVEEGKVTLDEVLASEDVVLRNTDGETIKVTATDKTVEVPVDFAKDGEIVNLSFKEEVTGESIDILSDKFSDAHKITYHTIAYDRNNVVRKDIYIVLYHAIPSSEFEMSLEMGEPIAPEIVFDVMVDPGTNLMAKIIEVDREDEQETAP